MLFSRRLTLPLGIAVALQTSTAPALATEPPPAEFPTESVQVAQATRANGGRRTRVEEIVVQARRRAERLEDTPISVTALTPDTLQQLTTTDIRDIVSLVPNLYSSGGGRGSVANGFQLRGVGSLEGGESGVGIYVDGAYLPRANSAVLNIVDIEQIEVLRGPQGTLFGKNVLGGAISIRSVRPKNELSGKLFLRPGNHGLIETRTTVNVPILEEVLMGRFSFSSANYDGHNLNASTGEDHANRNSLWFLGALRFVPHEDVEVNLNGNWFQSHTNGRGGRCIVEQAPPSLALAAILPAAFPDFVEKCNATTPRRFTSNVHPIFDSEDYGIWGNVTWDIGDVGPLENVRLRTLGAWREVRTRVREDVDYTDEPLVLLQQLGGEGLIGGEPAKDTQYLVETQLNVSALDGRFNSVVGVFAEWERRTRTGTVISVPGIADRQGGSSVGPLIQDDWDWAIFTQNTLDVFEWLSLTAGLRYTEEKRSVARRTIWPFGTLESPDGPVEISRGAGDQIFTSWTPMGSVALLAPESWLSGIPADSLMGYFTWSRGFTSGGFNAAIATGGEGGGLTSFDPAKLDNFEFGLKTVAFDGRLTVNAALFRMDYDDIQVVTVRATQPEDPDELPENFRITENAAKATLDGFELEAWARPFDGTMIQLALAVLDPVYDEFLSASQLDGQPLDRSGEKFRNTPRFTSFLAIQHSFPIEGLGPEWLDGYVTPRFEWSYQGGIHVGGPELRTSLQSGFHTYNARLSYTFWDDRAMVALWGKNLSDQNAITSASGATETFGYNILNYNAPLTFGAEISVSLG